VDWIGRKGRPVTPREVQQGCRWLKEPGAAESALNDLDMAGLGHWCDAPSTPRGGRPARTFSLSTGSTVYETTGNAKENAGFVDVDAVDACKDRPHASNGRPGLFGNTAAPGPYAEKF
jgi:hypothetical protein